MGWNIQQLRALCSAASLLCPEVYLSALHWKIERAKWHAGQSQLVWDNLSSTHSIIEFGDENWQETWFECETHIEAAAHNLHSMADILGQVINCVLLAGNIPEDKVTLSKVCQKLNSGIAPGVVSAIKQLQSSSEFKYINAFVNTIKHRRLLDTQYTIRVDFVQGQNQEGIRFKAFSYRKDSYPATWRRDIVGPYRERIVDLVCEVGNAINDHLRQQPLSL